MLSPFASPAEAIIIVSSPLPPVMLSIPAPPVMVNPSAWFVRLMVELLSVILWILTSYYYS